MQQIMMQECDHMSCVCVCVCSLSTISLDVKMLSVKSSPLIHSPIDAESDSVPRLYLVKVTARPSNGQYVRLAGYEDMIERFVNEHCL